MTFDWFNIFSLPEFLATGLVSRTFNRILEGYGNAEILVTRGNYTSIVYDDVILPVNFNDENPYVKDGYAIFKDTEDNVWLGIEVEA